MTHRRFATPASTDGIEFAEVMPRWRQRSSSTPDGQSVGPVCAAFELTNLIERTEKMNKRKLASLLIAAASTLVVAGGAQASDSATVTVNATVVAVCKFFTSSPTINLNNTGTGSNIDPSSSSDATGSVGITYRCTNGTTPAFTVPSSATVTCAACSGATMAPTITSTNDGAGSGMGSSNNKTLTVSGKITPANFENSPVGAYTGTMSVSVSP